MLKDYVVREKSVSHKVILLNIMDGFIGGLVLVAVFLMFTGLLYLIK